LATSAPLQATVTEFAKFCAVGASGLLVNLAVYHAIASAGASLFLAACAAFVVAVGSNYTWNRLWTFHCEGGRVVECGLCFFVVAATSLGANLLVLAALLSMGVAPLAAQVVAIVSVTPINFLGSKRWALGQLIRD